MQNKKIEDFGKHRAERNDIILDSGFKNFKKYFASDKKAYLEGFIPIKNNELIRFEVLMMLRSMDELV